MTKEYKVVAKVIRQKKPCHMGHKVGDEFAIGHTCPEGMCSWAFYSLFPVAMVLQYGGSLPWEKDPDRSIVVCPDPDSLVVFELIRIRGKSKAGSAKKA
ncbi:MAG: TIGR04076 family protein [Chloroflexi bacterium]|nr:TIGR04076 family protein [Chloroflexota bacterium]